MRRSALLIFLLLMSAAVISGCLAKTAGSTVPYPPTPLVVYETTAITHPESILAPGARSDPPTPFPLPVVPKTRLDIGLEKAFVDRVWNLYRTEDVLGIMSLLPPDRKTARYIQDDYGDDYHAVVEKRITQPKLTTIPKGYADWRIALSWRFDTQTSGMIYDEPGLPYIIYRVFFFLESPAGGETNASLDIARDRKTHQWYYLPVQYGKYRLNIGGNPLDPAYDNISWRYFVPPR